MSLLTRTSRILAVVGLVGVAGVASTTQASAFGFFGGGPRFGGGGHFGGFGFGPRFGGFGFGPRFGGFGFGPRFGGFGPGPRFGGFGPRFHRPFHTFGPRGPFGPFGPVPVVCRFGRCFPVGPVIAQPAYYPRPVYQPTARAYQPAAPAYQPAPAYSATAPAYSAAYRAPAPAPAPAAVQQPTTVSVLFQQTATSADIINFVKAYNVAVSSGPDANGVYRLQISTGPVPQDQLNQIVQSMQSQTNVVSQVGA